MGIMIENIDELHYMLTLFDDFVQLKGKKPTKTWLDKNTEVYYIKYEDGFLFEAPKDLIDILHDGAINDKNPIIENRQVTPV